MGRAARGIATVAAIAAAAGVSGCIDGGGPRPAGERCDRDGDCAGTLVCRYGRCRPVCELDRDCGEGEVCLPSEEGTNERVCSVPGDLCEEGGGGCPAGLDCVEGRCLVRCEAGSPCPLGFACEAGACRACEAGGDRDGDGEASWECGGGDCDDDDAARYPGATEICGDEVDSDCDGWLDPRLEPVGDVVVVDPDDEPLFAPALASDGTGYGLAWAVEGGLTSSCLSDRGAFDGWDVVVPAGACLARPAAAWGRGRYHAFCPEGREGDVRLLAWTTTDSRSDALGPVDATRVAAAAASSDLVVAWTWLDDNAGTGLSAATGGLDTTGPSFGPAWGLPEVEPGAAVEDLASAASGDLLALAWVEAGGAARLAVASVSGETLVHGPVEVAAGASGVALAFSGETLGLAWVTAGSDGGAMFSRVGLEAGLPLLDGSGVHLVGVGGAVSPRVALAAGSGLFVVASEYGPEASSEVKLYAVSAEGARLSPYLLASEPDARAHGPALAAAGSSFGLAWLAEVEGRLRVLFRAFRSCRG